MSKLNESTAIDEAITFVTESLITDLNGHIESAEIALPGLRMPLIEANRFFYTFDQEEIDPEDANSPVSVYVYMSPGSYEQTVDLQKCGPTCHTLEHEFALEIVIASLAQIETPICEGRTLNAAEMMVKRNRRYNAAVVKAMRCLCPKQPYICHLRLDDRSDQTVVFNEGNKPHFGMASTTWIITQSVKSCCCED